nr:TonB-dependent receptor [Kordiimonas laminariae]
MKKNAFSSVSPIQIISGEQSREIGFFAATDILQTTTQASGQQINNTFNNFVLDNGTGAATVGFRGLGADRTLVLVNGRRLAPAGVGGAPGVADTNLIPSVLVSSIENLFDGASAVYGSDAVAGVTNVILKKDVEGFEVEATTDIPEAGGGDSYTIGALYGDRGDNWNFTVAAEYFSRSAQSFAQNPFINACDEVLFEGPNGEIFNENQSQFSGSRIPGNGSTACNTIANNRIIVRNFGSIYFTEGSSNIGIPNFSEVNLPASFAGNFPDANRVPFDSNGDGVIDETDRFVVDGNGDGLVDVPFTDPRFNYGLSDLANSADIIQKLERKLVYFNGEYQFEDANDTEVFIEASYAHRDSPSFTGPGLIFPVVGANNPFNPVGVNGVDLNAGLIETNEDGTTSPASAFGPTTAQPVIRILGDRDLADAEVEQFRVIGGIRGNIGALDNFLDGNWSYEVYGSYARSNGDEVFRGLDAARLDLSLTTTIEDPDNAGSFICGADGDGDGVPDGTDGCVPVNLFASSLYQANGGTFATQAEADYLFIERIFRTEVEQTVFNGVVQGDLFALPWNDESLPILVGLEYREDSINSVGNDVATEGLLLNFFSDQGAIGKRYLFEAFAETAFNVVRDVPLIQSLDVEGSVRMTDEEFSPVAFTYSGKARWQITDAFTVRGTYGTSYRTPNLRERFLLGTTGFLNVTDPCVVPLDARVSDPTDPTVPETYDASGDEREARVLAACSANGVDPTALGLDDGTGNGFNQLGNSEVSAGGSTLSTEERSRSWTLGVVFDQPFTDAFDLRLSATYYNIRITDGINEPGANFVINQCFDNDEAPNGDSQFCNFIARDEDGQIDFVNRPFVNVGVETSKGIDFNLYYNQRFDLGLDDDLSVTVDTTATYVDELFFSSLGVEDDNAGEIRNPRWRASGTLRLGYKDFSLTWLTRWIQGATVDNPTDFATDNVACPFTGQICRPISSTTNYDVHNVSFSWNINENYFVNFGVRNVFDTSPPLVDDTDVFTSFNNPIGTGYNTSGRSFFASVRAKF